MSVSRNASCPFPGMVPYQSVEALGRAQGAATLPRRRSGAVTASCARPKDSTRRGGKQPAALRNFGSLDRPVQQLRLPKFRSATG
jgi:hypothetical protein